MHFSIFLSYFLELKAKNGNLQEFYVVPKKKANRWSLENAECHTNLSRPDILSFINALASSVLTILQMAITTSISSPSLSPLLFSKTHHTYFPRLDSHPNFCKFDRCCLPTVSSRQNPLCLSSSGTWVLNASLVRAEASGNGREPMIPPYNVLITGSTKGRRHSFVFFFSQIWFYGFYGFGLCSNFMPLVFPYLYFRYRICSSQRVSKSRG